MTADGRPTLREPLAARPLASLAGAVGGGAWMAVFGLFDPSLPGHAWWSLAAGLAAWPVAAVLARHGDRGVAAGVAVAIGIAWSATVLSVIVEWIRLARWPL